MHAAPSPVLGRMAWLLASVAMTLALSACNGTTAPGEDPPKRALDPRSEALRYFPATTDAIALLDTSDEGALSALNETLGEIPHWSRLRDRAADSLTRAGIDPDEILDLSRQPATEIDLPRPEIAFGTVPGAGPREGRVLIVLPTEQGLELDRIFREAAEAGGIEAAGTFDDARLYRGPDLDFAVRDGVLVAADDLNRLQQAITRRDGDREDQMDDAPVTALFNELPGLAALRGYTGPGPATDAFAELIGNAVLERLEAGTDGKAPVKETRPHASEAALNLRDEGGRLSIDMIVKLEQPEEITEATESEEPVDDQEPLPVLITADELMSALADLPAAEPLHRLEPLTPLVGAAWIDGSAIRARLITPT